MRINDSLMPKTTNGKEAVFVLALFVAATGLFSLDWFNGFPGGVSTVGAERVLAGDVPYRDFWTMYAPGHFYLLALIYWLFGTTFLVETVSATLFCAAATCCCYLLARKLGGNRLLALGCAAVFWAATYNKGYHKNLGSYPTAILFVFLALNCVALHYKTSRRSLLFWAGLATGAAAVFKHDVGGYTAIATVAGLIVFHLVQRFRTESPEALASLLAKIVLYSSGAVAIALPALAYFSWLAWPDMARNLVQFPLGDFPFSRPEAYPSLLPVNLYDASRVQTLENLCRYLIFALPFVCFLLGIATGGLAFHRRKPPVAALAATFSVAYFFHYTAAHVQINTHIISMSVYGALLVLLFVEFVRSEFNFQPTGFRQLCAVALAAVWLLSLAAAPVYKRWVARNKPTAALKLPKVSGVKLPAEEADDLTKLAEFVNASLPPGEPIFVGLHRHDVVVYGDVMLYFILDRPSATRYQELHPAITDTAPIQREIINDLERKKLPLIVLKQVFSDDVLDAVKRDFLKNLPHIGATELDYYIRENYAEARRFGHYQVWLRKENVVQVSSPERMEIRSKGSSTCRGCAVSLTRTLSQERSLGRLRYFSGG